jgi:hypothetical protein
LDRKQAIKEKLTGVREEFLAALGRLTDAQWAARGYGDDSEWRVADVLRHVADSERGMTNLMIQIKGGGEGVPADFDLHRWNQRVVTKLADKEPRELLDGMAANREALFAFIDGLEEADWDKRGRHASLRVMSIEEICHLIADHEAGHLAGIREALEN